MGVVQAVQRVACSVLLVPALCLHGGCTACLTWHDRRQHTISGKKPIVSIQIHLFRCPSMRVSQFRTIIPNVE
eukprot:8300263-Lingulodinium_polyedra.AAC.1